MTQIPVFDFEEKGFLVEIEQIIHPECDARYNPELVKQIIVSCLANKRKNVSKQKDRGEVKHSTRKPYRQKGTGKARAGMSSSPIWRGGGRTFPARTEENYHQKINKKMYRIALKMIIERLICENRIVIFKSFDLPFICTKHVNKILSQIPLSGCPLMTKNPTRTIVSCTSNKNLYLSSRNIKNIHTLCVSKLDPLCIIKSRQVIVVQDAYLQLRKSLNEI